MAISRSPDLRLSAVLALVACSPFGSSDAPSAPAPEAGAEVPASDGGTSEAPDGRAPDVPPLCPGALVARADFEDDFATEGWKPLVIGNDTLDNNVLDRRDGPFGGEQPASGKYLYFSAQAESVNADFASLILASPLVADPDSARLEWDQSIHQLDPYSVAGCTLSLESDAENGRIYLSNGSIDTGSTGFWANLDQWWVTPKRTIPVALTGLVTETWQHIAIEMRLSHGTDPQTVSMEVFVDRSSAAKLEEPWSPVVSGLRARCGALYSEPRNGTAHLEGAIDNVRLTVCPHPP